MRDIVDDLKERLRGVLARCADEVASYSEARSALEAKHSETISSLNAEQTALEQLLRLELARIGGAMEQPVFTKPKLSLVDFLITKVHADGPMKKEDLRQHAQLAGYFGDDDAGGRKVHATLMNLASSGRLHRLPDGKYAFPDRRSLENKENTDREDFKKTQEGVHLDASSDPSPASHQARGCSCLRECLPDKIRRACAGRPDAASPLY